MKNVSQTFSLMAILALTSMVLPSGASALASPQSSDLESLGTSSGTSDESRSLTSEVHRVERDESQKLISVTWSIENSGDEQVSMLWLRDRSYSYSGQNFAGITALDSDADTRYHPVMDGEGACLCSGSISNDLVQNLNSGDKVAYWSMFSVPSDIDSITIEIPNFDPIEDVPIS
ncbi:hypothetical protein ACFWTE_19215 [Nocardiopsis sp. NPDC058631]|uniref:hypothetical protein n=1 Tax=Nocardiopsis sp. NPDC058631 TaxID=3346566 RepID=UPI003653B3FE